MVDLERAPVPPGLWVFGYGSLIWNPGIEYRRTKVGCIRGYVRRFWQGNDTHRGTPQKLGRVATLVEEKGGTTWGRVFQLHDESKVSSLANLDHRESKLGGYGTAIVPFYPRDSKEASFPVLIYVALPSNPFFLGPAPLPRIADDIVHSRGVCGHNVEYLIRLADFMREHVPDFWDEHVFLLEYLVRTRLKEMNVPIKSLMGEHPRAAPHAADLQNDGEDQNGGAAAAAHLPSSSHFADMVPSRKLRCLNI